MKLETKGKLSIIVILLLLVSVGAIVPVSSFNRGQDFDKQAGENYFLKPGYLNSSYGPPDFDEKQEDCGWAGINPADGTSLQWFMCGPVALANCLWWLDCKVNNGTEQTYHLPDFMGLGSKNAINVVPTAEWISGWLNTTIPMGLPDEDHGTGASNMTEGILNLLNYTNVSDYVSLTVEGQGQWDTTPRVNYTNITYHLEDCDAVLLLLGFWCGTQRVGGHYVQVVGYNTSDPGLLFADPFFDNAELGEPGYYSPHNHDYYGNASHNWTVNVSYDFYPVIINTPGGVDGDWYNIDMYPCGNGSNWTDLNTWDQTYDADDWGCDNVNVTLEIAWYLTQECCVDVNKTVWNNSGAVWQKHLDTEYIENDTVTFNISWHDCGAHINNNVTVMDSFYDELNYDNGTAIFYHANGTNYAREPDYKTYESDPWHGHMYWNLTPIESAMDFCETSYIIFNCSVMDSGLSNNTVGVYIIPADTPDHEWWDTMCYNTSYATVGSQFATVECACCQTEQSGWTLSEHPNNNTLDYPKWDEYEPTRWLPYNETSDVMDNWATAYRYDNADGNGGDGYDLSYTIANETGSNRTQSIFRARTNYSIDMYQPYVGTIYSYKDSSNFDMVLYGFDEVYLLSMTTGGLVNTYDGTAVVDPYFDAYNYYTVAWPCNLEDSYDIDTHGQLGNGVWIKTIFNGEAGTIQSKGWEADIGDFDLCYEPCGWICDNETEGGVHYTFLEETDATCWGLVTWNPFDLNFTADFDKIDVWRLNYSRDEEANATELSNKPVYGNDGIPFMEWPTHNHTLKLNEQEVYYNCYEEWWDGNITFEELYDCMIEAIINLSAFFNLESRAYSPNISCDDSDEDRDQNDTIYYYTATFANITGQEYSEVLAIQVEDATDGTQDDFDSLVVAIDIDNNYRWDDNDVAIVVWSWFDPFFWWYVSNYTAYQGTNDIGTAPGIYANAGFEYCITDGWFEGFMPPVHRYTGHRVYTVEAPRYYFEKYYKGSGVYLNENDTFGLHIMTVNRGLDEDETLTSVWENWNESNNYSLYNYYTSDDEYSGHLQVWDDYMNLSTDALIEDFYNGTWTGVNESRIKNWGNGRIEGWHMQDDYFSINATKECNVSQINDTSTWNWVDYNITICNDGNRNVTNLVVNDTLPEGSTYVSTNLNPVNVTGSDRNYTINLTTNLINNTCINFTLTINVSAGAASEGTYLYNTINATVLQAGVYALANDSFQYGENVAPTINWTYPVNKSVSVNLLLYNISCYIYDANGDQMNITFYSNKSDDTWSPVWNAIGTNSTVTNGAYMCNQTFNNSGTYNTRWRWGNTTYYYWINVSDGTIWTNRSYAFRTENSRYDVTSSGDVVPADVSVTWIHRTPSTYYGIYDVDGGGDVVPTDISIIWANKT